MAVVGVLTAAGVSWIKNGALEWTILAASVCIGLFVLLPSYRRVHRPLELLRGTKVPKTRTERRH